MGAEQFTGEPLELSRQRQRDLDDPFHPPRQRRRQSGRHLEDPRGGPQRHLTGARRRDERRHRRHLSGTGRGEHHPHRRAGPERALKLSPSGGHEPVGVVEQQELGGRDGRKRRPHDDAAQAGRERGEAGAATTPLRPEQQHHAGAFGKGHLHLPQHRDVMGEQQPTHPGIRTVRPWRRLRRLGAHVPTAVGATHVRRSENLQSPRAT